MDAQHSERSRYTVEALDRAVNALKNYISTAAPGLLDILNVHSVSRYGKEFLKLFVESPCNAYKIIANLYKDKAIALYVFNNLFIKPLGGVVEPNTMREIYGTIRQCSE